jgi:hypothetical protein
MSGLLLERFHIIKGKDPVADAFSGAVGSDVVDMSAFERVLFIRHDGVGAVGTSTVQVEACDDTTPTNHTPIPFHYREVLTGDTEAAAAAATVAAGVATTAQSSKLVVAEVHHSALAATGYRYVRALFTEVANDPVLGGVLILGEARLAGAIKASAID